MVPRGGLEPPRYRYRQILSLLRLPFRHPGVFLWGSEVYFTHNHRIDNEKRVLFPWVFSQKTFCVI